MSTLMKSSFCGCLLAVLLFFSLLLGANQAEASNAVSMDRIQLVTQQIGLLQNRYAQSQRELLDLQKQHDLQISELVLEKASKKLLDKASLEILVAKSNLDSVNMEIADTHQTINWFEKNVDEIANQLNVLRIFGIKVSKSEQVNIQEYHSDLDYQKKLINLEKERVKWLQKLQSTSSSILQLRKESYVRLNTQLKTYRLLNIKQQQDKDELAYQEQQTYWLQQLNVLYANIKQIDPAKSKEAYLAAERDIFYANESANYAYARSLVARYRDQIKQMKLVVFKNNSISLLNEIGDQVLALSKQIARVNVTSKNRSGVLNRHIGYLSQKKSVDDATQAYIDRLKALNAQYLHVADDLIALNKSLAEFRLILEKALQVELSARQGLPTFDSKMWIDLGKEMQLVPALVFHLTKSLTTNFIKGVEAAGVATWCVFAVVQSLLLFCFIALERQVSSLLKRAGDWRNKINSKWLSLQWLQRNFIEFALIANMIGIMCFFNVPTQNYMFIVYLSFVWLVFKSIMTISRVCLVEATHDTSGHDVKLYQRLKWIILIGGVITALTVFAHQLPLIYELKILFDRLFLLFLMVVSLLVLRSWWVFPHLVLSHMGERHPYFEKSVRFIGFLIPILLFGNSVIGLFGYVNLVMTISGYEGVFLLVLIGYLILRGLFLDAMEHASRLVIQHVSNGWLWTEAFLKPIDKIIRIVLFLSAWSVLFLLYGWDKQSPIVERLYGLLHYKLIHVLNTTITPLGIIELFVAMSVFYWSAKWTREFVYRLLQTRTSDMGIRNSIAILTQYSVVVLGAVICMRVLGIDLQALTFIVTALAFGVGFGLRDLANNFVCGFLILLERPLRVGDIVSINAIEGEVTHIGGRAVTVRTWDYMDLVVPNAEIFNKSFTNWTYKDNIVRSVITIKIGRQDNPHEVKLIIHEVLATHDTVLKYPMPEVFLKEMDDITMDFEIRYFVNIRQVKSRTSVISDVHLKIWDAFAKHGIKPPYPQQEIIIRQRDEAVLKEEFSDKQSLVLEHRGQ